MFPLKTECEYIGKISRQHGGEGFVLLNLHHISANEFEEFEYVFLDIQDKLVPFFIQNCNVKSNSVYVQFDNVNSSTQAEKLCGYAMFVPKQLIEADVEEISHELLGFTLFDKDVCVGEISDIIEFPMHAVFQIFDANQNEILIPYANELIIEIQHEKKIIIMDLPEGLLEN